jgi:methyltransferase
MMVIAAGCIVFTAMLLETAVSARHERTLRAMGAVEPDGDVYRAMAVVYPGAFAAMLLEGWWRGAPIDAWFYGGAAVFVASKALKYWAIASLGPRWTFRVLVPPQSTLVTSGPYRWFAHPNYVAVLGELAGVAIAMRAPVAGAIGVAGFALLIYRRVGVEEKALSRR